MGEPFFQHLLLLFLLMCGPIQHPLCEPTGIFGLALLIVGEPILPASLPFLIMGEPILIIGEPPATSLLLFITELMFDLTPGDAPAAPVDEVSTAFLHLFMSEPGIGLNPDEAPVSLPFLIMGGPILIMGEPIHRLPGPIFGPTPGDAPAVTPLLSELVLCLCEPIVGLALLLLGEPIDPDEPAEQDFSTLGTLPRGVDKGEEEEEAVCPAPNSMPEPGRPGPWPTPGRSLNK